MLFGSCSPRKRSLDPSCLWNWKPPAIPQALDLKECDWCLFNSPKIAIPKNCFLSSMHSRLKTTIAVRFATFSSDILLRRWVLLAWIPQSERHLLIWGDPHLVGNGFLLCSPSLTGMSQLQVFCFCNCCCSQNGSRFAGVSRCTWLLHRMSRDLCRARRRFLLHTTWAILIADASLSRPNLFPR